MNTRMISLALLLTGQASAQVIGGYVNAYPSHNYVPVDCIPGSRDCIPGTHDGYIAVEPYPGAPAGETVYVRPEYHEYHENVPNVIEGGVYAPGVVTIAAPEYPIKPTNRPVVTVTEVIMATSTATSTITVTASPICPDCVHDGNCHEIAQRSYGAGYVDGSHWGYGAGYHDGAQGRPHAPPSFVSHDLQPVTASAHGLAPAAVPLNLPAVGGPTIVAGSGLTPSTHNAAGEYNNLNYFVPYGPGSRYSYHGGRYYVELGNEINCE